MGCSDGPFHVILPKVESYQPVLEIRKLGSAETKQLDDSVVVVDVKRSW